MAAVNFLALVLVHSPSFLPYALECLSDPTYFLHAATKVYFD